MKDPHSELIRLAAMLARGDLLPKIDTERWYASTPMAERRQITEAIESAHERHKVLALDVRQIADTLRPSVQPTVVQCEHNRLDVRGQEGDQEVFCPDCGEVHRAADNQSSTGDKSL